MPNEGVTPSDIRPSIWGSTPETWQHFAEGLGWRKTLLPVVSNPERKISEESTMRVLGKTPSQVTFRGTAAGFPKWTTFRASPANIEKWSSQPDHGICVQTGHGIIAIDIDVPSEKHSETIRECIRDLTGVEAWPERYREGTGKTLLVFEWPWGDLYKRKLNVEGGLIEVLGVGQQFIADGTYIRASDGVPQGRYLWRVGDREGLPERADLPMLDEKQFDALMDGLEVMVGYGEWAVARSRRGPLEGVDLPPPGDDRVANWLLDNWPVHDVDPEGWMHIVCPFEHEHTTDSGPTSTTYFPAGTGGYQQGYFHCLHAHCQDRAQVDFREQCGFERDQFPELPDLPEGEGEAGGGREGGKALIAPRNVRDLKRQGGGALGSYWPSLMRNDKDGTIDATQSNVIAALGDPDIMGVRIAYDEFTAGVVWAPSHEPVPQWREITDGFYTDMRVKLEQKGFFEFGKERLREGVQRVAEANTVDMAIAWLEGLKWDGVKRIDTFIPDTLPGTIDSPYTRALSRYMWTTLAGRVLEPGVKADMMLVLVGKEGLRKSSWVKALAPYPEYFTDSVSLEHRDTDNSRKLRGRMVVELAELKGLAGRSGEEIRAFIAQQEEEWIPKYKETNIKFRRRCLLIGTTNDEQFLEARMGMRRLLPLYVPAKGDIKRLERDRDQLWAEAAVKFLSTGVDWSVEDLAQDEREAFMSYDPWMGAVARWLLTKDPVTNAVPANDGRRFSTEDVLVAVGEPVGRHGRAAQIRAGEVLRELGCEQKKMEGGPRRYVVPAEVLERIKWFAEREEGSAF